MLDSRCAHRGQPMRTRGTADVHTRGTRCAHAGQPMYICGAAHVHKWGSRCAHAIDGFTARLASQQDYDAEEDSGED